MTVLNLIFLIKSRLKPKTICAVTPTQDSQRKESFNLDTWNDSTVNNRSVQVKLRLLPPLHPSFWLFQTKSYILYGRKKNVSCWAGIHCNANAEHHLLQDFHQRIWLNCKKKHIPSFSFSCSYIVDCLKINPKINEHTTSEKNGTLSKYSGF